MTKGRLSLIVSSLLLSNFIQPQGTPIKVFIAKCVHKCLIISKILRATTISIDNILSQPPHRTVYLKKVKDIVEELNRINIAKRSPYFDIFAKGLLLDSDNQFFISINPNSNYLELCCNNSPEDNQPFLEDRITMLFQNKNLVTKHQLFINISLTPKASFWLKNYKLATTKSESDKSEKDTILSKITLCDKLVEAHPVLKFFTDDPTTVPLPQVEPNLYFHDLLFSIPETKLVAKSLFFRKKLKLLSFCGIKHPI